LVVFSIEYEIGWQSNLHCRVTLSVGAVIKMSIKVLKLTNRVLTVA
jgi:hypothetical protein